jgi:hypothetical protein
MECRAHADQDGLVAVRVERRIQPYQHLSLCGESGIALPLVNLHASSTVAPAEPDRKPTLFVGGFLYLRDALDHLRRGSRT